jgi:hypothetical protein
MKITTPKPHPSFGLPVGRKKVRMRCYAPVITLDEERKISAWVRIGL